MPKLFPSAVSVLVLVLALGVAGCTKSNGPAAEYVDEWLELIKDYQFQAAYNELSATYAFSEYGSMEEFRIWLVSTSQRGKLKQMTSANYFDTFEPDTRTVEVYLHYPANDRYTRFRLKRDGDDFRIDDLAIGISKPMNR